MVYGKSASMRRDRHAPQPVPGLAGQSGQTGSGHGGRRRLRGVKQSGRMPVHLSQPTPASVSTTAQRPRYLGTSVGKHLGQEQAQTENIFKLKGQELSRAVLRFGGTGGIAASLQMN